MVLDHVVVVVVLWYVVVVFSESGKRKEKNKLLERIPTIKNAPNDWESS